MKEELEIDITLIRVIIKTSSIATRFFNDGVGLNQ